jgi:membrane-bound lytic murein transglycosylase A
MANSNKRIKLAWLCLVLWLLQGCHPGAREEVSRPEDAISPVSFFYPTFQDDLDLDSLHLALKRNTEYLKRLDPEYLFQYGQDRFTARQVLESDQALMVFLEKRPDRQALRSFLKKNFRIYRAAGRADRSGVLFTGYYEPVLDASLSRDETYRYPIYHRPDDLIVIDLSQFDQKYKGERLVARISEANVLPYFTRADIELHGVLEGRQLELAWLKDPVDTFFLQIQGSGRLRLQDGRTIAVGYDASNGRPYRSIGRYMAEQGLLPLKAVSMERIRAYLFQHPEAVSRILTQNPSYVFFRKIENGPLGNIGVTLTPGRSVALDAKLFPKGALGFISCQRPELGTSGEIREWRPFSRLVLNQDTGGAIKGAGRVDIFWGSGRYAEVTAGQLKHEGELFILIKKFN